MTAAATAEALRSDLLRGVPHGFFTRNGGVSTGLWASLNCGPGSADAPAAVAENRARVARALGAGTLLFLHQVHSADAVTATGPWQIGPPRADAAVTAVPGLGLGVLSADCAPVLFHDAQAGVVGAAHAGWRGALSGVLEATLAAMEGLGGRADRVRAAVGPCISQAAYEVGPEFLETFTDDDPAAGRFFASGARDRPMFDLPGYVLARLRAAGVAEAGWIGRCTYGDENRFYSHRRGVHRGETCYGRLASAVMLPA